MAESGPLGENADEVIDRDKRQRACRARAGRGRHGDSMGRRF